jgi:hypothetical protein
MLSVLAHTLMTAPQTLDEVVMALAPAADLEVTLVLRAARQTLEQLENAAAQTRA